MAGLRNRSLAARLVLGALALIPLAALRRVLADGGSWTRWGRWIPRREHPAFFWLTCGFFALLAGLFLVLAVAPNRKTHA
jgi:hypothetical protein